LMPIMSVVALSCHVPPRSRTSSLRAVSHTRSDSISTPSRSNTTAAGSATERPYRRACQHEPVPTDDVEAIRALIHEYAERVDGRWRFADRQIIPDLIGDLSRHLRDASTVDARE